MDPIDFIASKDARVYLKRNEAMAVCIEKGLGLSK